MTICPIRRESTSEQKIQKNSRAFVTWNLCNFNCLKILGFFCADEVKFITCPMWAVFQVSITLNPLSNRYFFLHLFSICNSIKSQLSSVLRTVHLQILYSIIQCIWRVVKSPVLKSFQMESPAGHCAAGTSLVFCGVSSALLAPVCSCSIVGLAERCHFTT